MSGRELSRRLYEEVVLPQLGSLPHAATLLGVGSDATGLDTATSTDHGWGPRVQILLPDDTDAPPLDVPETFAGWPVLGVDVVTVRGLFTAILGFDPTLPIALESWLITPTQTFHSLVSGTVHHDPDGRVLAAIDAVRWYPHDLWLYALGCQWRRISQEEHFVGRAAELGDDLGARLLAGRLARDVMRLSFLQERTWAPYMKWFGTVFRTLPSAARLREPLAAAVAAPDHDSREAGLCAAYEEVARRHNELGVTETLEPSTSRFFTRGMRVLFAGRFADACFAAITDPVVAALPITGTIDQWVDSTEPLGHRLPLCRRAGAMYGVGS